MVRIHQGAAQGSDIVPVGPASISDNGLSQALPASAGPEHTLAEGTSRGDEPVKNDKEIEERNNTIPATLIEDADATQIERVETASTVSENTRMHCDEHRASKRKISHSAERCLSEDSEDESLKRVKTARRRRIFDDDIPLQREEQSKSNPDLTHRPSEDEPRIVKMKKGYISKQKRLEIEEMKEEIADKKRDEIRRKKEEKMKEEDEKRKKEERIKAEANIIAKIGTKPTYDKDYIENMTASELAAMALEFLDHVEIIRTKCGTMQGVLSGELKRRKTSLDNMVRALQAKAEENGDPLFLRAKIEELLKKNKEEDERKKREISELKEVVANLTKENKEMRRELKLIRESIERKERTHSPIPRRKETIEDNRNTYRKKEEIYADKEYPTVIRDNRKHPSMSSHEEGPVMRPPLKGRSTVILNSNLKHKREEISDENRKKKPEIKVIGNIQIKPPRKEMTRPDRSRDELMDRNETEKMDME